MTAAAETIYSFSAKPLISSADNNTIDFSIFKGHPTIIVNGASHCGYTESNYTGLSQLLSKYADRKSPLKVVIFPCNQFRSQESDGAEAIQCKLATYDDRFVVTEKVNVNGNDAHPLWVWLKKKCPGFITNSIKWNFTKFVVDHRGNPVARFAPNDDPEKLVSSLDKIYAEMESEL